MSQRQNIDGFGRLSVAEPMVLFDCKFLNDKRLDLWDERITGAGGTSTFIANQASIRLRVSNTTAGTVIRQTLVRLNYTPAFDFNIILTAVVGTIATTDPASDVVKRFGYYDSSNGVFFQQDINGFAVVIRSYTSGSVVERVVYQSNFNVSTASWFDPTKANIFYIRFGWLGVATVEFGLVVNSTYIALHRFTNENVFSTVYMSSPNLPVRFELVNGGNGAQTDFYQICSSICSNGVKNITTNTRAITTGLTAIQATVSTTIYPLISLRLKYNDVNAKIKDLSVLCSTTAQIEVLLILTPTFAGTAPTFIDNTNSGVQSCVHTNATTVSAVGTLLYSSHHLQASDSIAQANVFDNNFRLGVFADGSFQVITLAVRKVSAQAEDLFGSLTYIEY